MAKTKKEETASDKDQKEEKARKKAREAVAKHLRFKVACKNAIIKRKKVEYFAASKAVDCLMESKWAKGAPPADGDDITPYFADRSDAIVFCRSLLKHQLILRVRKVEVKPKSQSEEEKQDSGKKKRGKKEAEEGTKKKGKATDSPRAKTNSPRAKKTEKSAVGEEGKRKKKFRLELHPQQTLVDSSEDLYIWQFDPASNSTYILGFAVVVGAIAVTMQPLWPKSTQVGIWYLSMVLFAIIGVLVGVIVLRWFLYGLILIITVGKVTFWVFPNLDSEKCGFFESFQPFYSVEFAKQKKKKKSKGVRAESSKEKDGSGEEKYGEGDADTSTEEGEEGEGEGEGERKGEGEGERKGEGEGGEEEGEDGEEEGEGDYERDEEESNFMDESARQSIETET